MAGSGRVEILRDVVFAQAGGRDLHCDIYEPPDEVRNDAAVLLLHGGSWISGDKSQLRGYGILLGRAGFTCIASEYRLLPEARWPAQIHDAKAALRWVRANAGELAIDPDKIVAEGNSAGAHLALLLAGTPGVAELEGDANLGVSSEVAAVMAVYPPTQLVGLAELGEAKVTEGRRQLVGMFGEGEEAKRNAALASPVSHASADFPPTLLIHGTNDTTVPVEASIKMFEALTKAGVPVDLHLMAEQPHAFDAQPQFGRHLAEEMLLFLSRYVTKTTPTWKPLVAGAART